jgi:hypothetical protein
MGAILRQKKNVCLKLHPFAVKFRENDSFFVEQKKEEEKLCLELKMGLFFQSFSFFN